MKRILYEYQRDALQYCNTVAHPALFISMRLGKSLITIRHILRDLSTNFYTNPILFVAPYSALYTWKSELMLEGIPENEISILCGSPSERETAWLNLKQFVLINKEGFLSLPFIAMYQWGAVVCDESVFLKNPKSKVSKFFSKNFRNVQRRYILTGTPSPEGPLDLFQQLKFLDPKILPFANYWVFRNQCFQNPINKRTGLPINYEWEMKPESMLYIEQRLKKYCFLLTKEDCGIYLPKIFAIRKIKMPENIRKIYQTVEKDFLLEIEGRIEDATIYAMEKFVWLRRICGGSIRGKNLWPGKTIELCNLLSGELFSQAVVIWCAFIDELNQVKEVLLRLLGMKAIVLSGQVQPSDREPILQQFKNGSVQVLIAQPECFKFGQDLSCADTEIYYSSPLGLLTREQSQARIENIRKPRNILIMDLLVEDTVDEDIYWMLKKKEKMQAIVHSMMQRIDSAS